MNENVEKKEFDINNTVTQKTVRLKPMIKKPLVTTEPTNVKTVSTNSQPLAATALNAENPTAPKAKSFAVTASVPIKKVVLPNRTPAAAMESSINKPNSILNSLNLKPKAPETNINSTGVSTSSNDANHVAQKSSPAVDKLRASVETATVAVPKMSSAPTQRLSHNRPMDTSTGVVPKVNTDEKVKDIADDATVKLQRPERKGASLNNSIVPKIEKKEPVVTEAPKVAPATPVAPKVEAVAPVTPVAPAVPQSKAPTLKLNSKAPTLAKPAMQTASAPIQDEIKKDDITASTQASAPKLSMPKKAEPEKKAEETKEATAEAEVNVKSTAKKGAKQKSDVVIINNGDDPTASKGYLLVILITFLLVSAAAVMSAIQYLNVFEQSIIGKEIELPIISEIGK